MEALAVSPAKLISDPLFLCMKYAQILPDGEFLAQNAKCNLTIDRIHSNSTDMYFFCIGSIVDKDDEGRLNPIILSNYVGVVYSQ